MKMAMIGFKTANQCEPERLAPRHRPAHWLLPQLGLNAPATVSQAFAPGHSGLDQTEHHDGCRPLPNLFHLTITCMIFLLFLPL